MSEATNHLPVNEENREHLNNGEEHGDVVDGNAETATKKKPRKKHKKKKTKSEEQPVPQEGAPTAATSFDLKTVQNALAALDKSALLPEDPATKNWRFWDTQPVPKLSEQVVEVGPIEADKESVRQEPYSLPNEFEWDTIDLGSPHQLEEVYKLLNENYVEDEDNMFRFDYSAEFLQWALRPPGWVAEWHCGVRVKKNKTLVGFITAIPANVKVYETQQHMVEINFLCVHKKLRSKRVAPVLIREITRRVNLHGIFQAVYTAGIVLPKPVAKCRYYHRSLNPKKLVDVKFSQLGRNQTMQRLIKLMRLPEETSIRGLRQMKTSDVEKCHKLLEKHLQQFNLAPIFSKSEVAHFFLPHKNVIDTYVVQDETGEITDMASYFSLPSSIMHHPEHKVLYAAYFYYTVATKHTLKELMKDMLILAKKSGFDVFNALDLMDNQSFLKDLKFGMGDGNLHYYLYNFKCPDITEDKVALILQ
uniref:Glycylpeptide N-tetradecanoyltransferase n=1 Tax=Phallusia mammillata TaxID=59560 RepID=A0A6F9DN31_9ASCI|nr:glycylpeptide N-tetradecanoyltransferase 1 [Phallusia mammillata]